MNAADPSATKHASNNWKNDWAERVREQSPTNRLPRGFNKRSAEAQPLSRPDKALTSNPTPVAIEQSWADQNALSIKEAVHNMVSLTPAPTKKPRKKPAPRAPEAE